MQITERFHDPLFHTQLESFRLDGMPDVPQVNQETMDPRGEAVSLLSDALLCDRGQGRREGGTEVEGGKRRRKERERVITN